MKFSLVIKSNNEAMVEMPEYAVADLLEETARKLREGRVNGVLRDGSNGGPVGNWKLTVSSR